MPLSTSRLGPLPCISWLAFLRGRHGATRASYLTRAKRLRLGHAYTFYTLLQRILEYLRSNLTMDVAAALPPRISDLEPRTSGLGPRTSDLGPGISDLGSRTSNLGPRTSDLGPRTSDLGPRTSNLGPRTSDLGPRTSDLGPRTSDLGPRTLDLGHRTSDLGPRTSDLGPRTSESEPRTSDLEPKGQSVETNFFLSKPAFFSKMFLCFFFLAWMLSLLVYMGLCCVSVGSSMPRCCPYLASMLGLCWICNHDPGSWLVGSMSMLDLLCWAYMLVYVGSAEMSTNV